MRASRWASLKVVLAAFIIWLSGILVVEWAFPDTGYRLFLVWKLVSPSLIAPVLYVRALRARRHDDPKRSLASLHFAWLMTVGVVVASRHQFWVAYLAMDDAPRGLLMDLYQFEALVSGTVTYLLCTLIASGVERGE